MLNLSRESARRFGLALGLYSLLLAVYAWVAGEARLVEHTPFNHFSLLADGWLNGHLDLGRVPPGYAQSNDFAHYQGKWYVTFPGFPAVLLLPLVYLAGSVERVRDGQFFVWLAPLGPAVLFLALERLRELERTARSQWENVGLALFLALGSVYFFTAVQGTVWFAAHVVAVALVSAFLLFSIGARRPWLAGLCLGLSFWTRTPTIFAFPFFAYEAWRACRPAAGSAEKWDVRGALGLWGRFSVPLALLVSLALIHNYARFGSPFDFGYTHLQIAWKGRVERWGLMSYHYLPRNLGVLLTSLPWVGPLRVNVHGLALWLTTPGYLWLIWPKRLSANYAWLLLAAAAVSVPTLLYQNTGWQQFGYRFSNDYAPLLVLALALCGRRFGPLFWGLAVWALGLNAFGAITFDRPEYSHFYYRDLTQKILYQPD